MDSETIYLALLDQGTIVYHPVEAKRTTMNYFEILSIKEDDTRSGFHQGDIVRCRWRYFGETGDGGIVATSLATEPLPNFSIGEKVEVSRHAGWKQDFTGTIVSGPEETSTLLGPDNLWWIEFDQPQEDFSGGYEYIKAEIISTYISRK